MKKLATLVTKTRAAGDATPLVAARNPPTKICGKGKRDAQIAMGRCVVPMSPMNCFRPEQTDTVSDIASAVGSSMCQLTTKEKERHRLRKKWREDSLCVLRHQRRALVLVG